MVQAVTLGVVSGMLMPWFPELRVTDPPSGPKRLARRRRLGPARTIWQQLTAGLRWLTGRQIVDPNQTQAIERIISRSVDRDWNLFDYSISQKLADALAESMDRGEGHAEWQARAAKIGEFSVSQAEAIGRTYTHRAYYEGLQTVMQSPVVRDEFPYIQYMATRDTRTRPTHAAMDGKVARLGSSLAVEMERLHSEWGCRCSIVPISIEDARGMGLPVDEPDDLPETGAAAIPSRPLDVSPTFSLSSNVALDGATDSP